MKYLIIYIMFICPGDYGNNNQCLNEIQTSLASTEKEAKQILMDLEDKHPVVFKIEGQSNVKELTPKYSNLVQLIESHHKKEIGELKIKMNERKK